MQLMAFMFTQKAASMTLDVVAKFAQEKRKKKAQERKMVDVTNLVDYHEAHDDEDVLKAYGKDTPENAKRRTNSQKSVFNKSEKDVSTPNSRKYEARSNAGESIATFGDETATFEESDELVKITEAENNVKGRFPFMFESLREKAAVLDEWIYSRAEDETVVEEDFTIPNPDSFSSVGRVCCDSCDARMNAHSVLLQGTQDACHGKTVRLDVTTKAADFALFPGQVISAEGINPSGEKIVASKIDDFHRQRTCDLATNADLSLIVASGPYTTSDNIGFSPLDDLLEKIAKERPQVAFLVGPFLDVRNDHVVNYAEDSFPNMFEKLIMTRIQEAASKAPKTTFILVASQNDVHHMGVYPTPRFDETIAVGENVQRKYASNVYMAGDPFMATINSVRIGVSATDVLFHIGKEEIAGGASSGDRLARLARHVIAQKSFYPLYPPNEELNVDSELWEKHARFKIEPDLLILPSDLMHFCKDVNGATFVVNPGRLAKRESGGVFAKIRVISKGKNDNGIQSRFVANIVRI